MQRVLIGLLLTVVLAVGVTATETWAAWRVGGVAYLPLDDAERETLLACGDPGARGLAKVIAQDVRVDCAIDVQLAWLATHDGAPQVVKALERRTSARGELRRAWLAWLSGRRAPVSTALENPDLPVTDRRALIAWLAGHRDLPVMHPRTREALAIQRLDMDGWIPEPWVTARALEGDEGMVAVVSVNVVYEWMRSMACRDALMTTSRPIGLQPLEVRPRQAPGA